MSEPFNSIVLVLAGALFGAWFAGCWCGCLSRWRWRRSWRRLVERNGGVFEEEAACRRDQTARFHACQDASAVHSPTARPIRIPDWTRCEALLEAASAAFSTAIASSAPTCAAPKLTKGFPEKSRLKNSYMSCRACFSPGPQESQIAVFPLRMSRLRRR